MNKTDKDIEKMILDDDRISMYLQGKMNADEEASFMEELKTNEDLRQRAIAQARLIKGMNQADAELVDAFKQADKQTIIDVIHESRNYPNIIGSAAITGSGFEEDEDSIDFRKTYRKERNDNKQVIEQRKLSYSWLTYAASIILIVFVGFKGYDYYHTVNLGKQYATTIELSEIVRGEANSDIEAELKTLFDNVANGKDLSKTTERLDAIWQIAKQDTYTDYTDYAPYIGWYLAVGYLRDYEKAKAKGILIEMKEMYPEGNSIGDKIEEVWERCN